MNSGAKQKCVYAGEEGIEEVLAESGPELLVKTRTFFQVLQRLRQDLNLHFARLRSAVFAVSQSMNGVLPLAICTVRSLSMSSCQVGDSTESGIWAISFQSNSMASSFSRIVISLNGKIIDMASA